jgi:hypothetical protein
VTRTISKRLALVVIFLAFLGVGAVFLSGGPGGKKAHDGSLIVLHESARGTTLAMHSERNTLARRLLYSLPKPLRSLLPLRYQVNVVQAFSTSHESIFVVVGRLSDRSAGEIPTDMAVTLLDADHKELGEFSALSGRSSVYSTMVQFVPGGPSMPVYERESKLKDFTLQPWAIPAPATQGPFFVRFTFWTLRIREMPKEKSTFEFELSE